jgi:hypothetical protein
MGTKSHLEIAQCPMHRKPNLLSLALVMCASLKTCARKGGTAEMRRAFRRLVKRGTLPAGPALAAFGLQADPTAASIRPLRGAAVTTDGGTRSALRPAGSGLV